MAENYIEIVASSRALLLDEEAALEGNTLVSMETDEGNAEASVNTYIQEHFGQFLGFLRRLDKEDQEMVLEYYILGKPQAQLGIVHHTTQTICSQRLRYAIKQLLGHLLLGDKLTQPMVAGVLEEAGVEDVNIGKKAPLSHVVCEYDVSRNFSKIAHKWGVHRPLIRKVLLKASTELMEKPGRPLALGSYLHAILDGAAAEGTGKSKRRRENLASLYTKIPDICGEFRVDVNHPDFGHFFKSRAMRD